MFLEEEVHLEGIHTKWIHMPLHIDLPPLKDMGNTQEDMQLSLKFRAELDIPIIDANNQILEVDRHRGFPELIHMVLPMFLQCIHQPREILTLHLALWVLVHMIRIMGKELTQTAPCPPEIQITAIQEDTDLF